MRTFFLLRKKSLPLPCSIPPPLQSTAPFLHRIPHLRSQNDSMALKPPLPFMFKCILQPAPTITRNVRNEMARSFASRSGKNIEESPDNVCRDDEEWCGEINLEDLKKELLTDEDDAVGDDDYNGWEEEEEVESQIDDGGDGGGVVLKNTSWGSKALAIAEEVLLPLKDDLKIYAFKTSDRGYIYVRLDKLSDKYGCPQIDDIENFHSLYTERLEKVAEVGDLPDNLAVEVSSPGAERFVRVPEELARFKGLPMHVSYVNKTIEAETEGEKQDGIFQVESINLELEHCIWKLANVKFNREAYGKGRSLSKKQKDWRLNLPFSSVKFVRLYMEG